ncbi:Histidine kinase-, DNA gyrase B-, and HSP90-like ATPase [Actinacidiphila glaucinigra]|uniref:histidine kinase n=1 Tax=Actinacidiphila glaucinigra TaxID=235986 RepID=A0A239LUQ7_9ACTN|nr:Histidine kinase-, DNA gyrase B-, and HSP90-like ATPase [Actinacidiphila glaucinigra]
MVAALTSAAVGGGWLADSLSIVPASAAAAASGSLVLAVGVWAGVRRIDARRRTAAQIGQLRHERDRLQQALRDVSDAVAVGRKRVAWAVDQASQGQFARGESAIAPVESGDLCTDVLASLQCALAEGWQAVLRAAEQQHEALAAEAELADLARSITPRMQSLVNRGIALIERVERSVEDPDLLHELFQVDHLLTQMRRAGESLAVLGGSTPPEHAQPLLVATALRRAVAEIEHYPRVRIAQQLQPSRPFALPGYVSPSVVHLLAEIMDNAARYSTDKVEVYTTEVRGGLLIEVLDRGGGIPDDKRAVLNDLLARPEAVERRARVKDGQIGLLVAALLARRYRINVQLRPSLWGGVQAIVAIPEALLLQHEAEPAEATAELRLPASPAPQPSLLEVPSPPPGQAAAGLPRRRGTSSSHAASQPPSDPVTPDATGREAHRPPLVRRSSVPRERVPQRPAPAPRGTTAGSPAHDFMAQFTARETPSPTPSDH